MISDDEKRRFLRDLRAALEAGDAMAAVRLDAQYARHCRSMLAAIADDYTGTDGAAADVAAMGAWFAAQRAQGASAADIATALGLPPDTFHKLAQEAF